MNVQLRLDYGKDIDLIMINGKLEDTIMLPAIDLRAAVIATVGTIEGMVRMRLVVESGPRCKMEMILEKL